MVNTLQDEFNRLDKEATIPLESLLLGLDTTSEKRMSVREMARLYALLKEYTTKEEFSGFKKWFVPGGPYSIDKCPKHRAFFAAGAEFRQRLFMAGNRVGKSISGAYELALHATGQYPEWWEGRRFDKPIMAYGAGQTSQTTRDTVQKELMGPPGAIGTGMIPLDCVGRTWAKPGTPNAIETVEVKHVSGGTSLITFKSYDQEIKAFYGVALDVVWFDEECPHLIYNEAFLRTMTTNGIIYVTFTPLHGTTSFVSEFCRGAEFLAGAQPIVVIDPKFTESE